MKKVFSLALAISIFGNPTLAWDWSGEGGCSYSKDKTKQEIKTEQVQGSET